MNLVDGDTAPSIQQRLYPGLACFGCGSRNPKGLGLRSYPSVHYLDDGIVTAEFLPSPEHDNGLGYLNGGIIATIVDCHSAAAVMLEAERQDWSALAGADLAFVTAGLDLRYLRPSPLTEVVQLRAVVTVAQESQMTATVELVWNGKACAVATAQWKRWRPRT